MTTALRNYLTITGGYWAFTLTDGAIRMLVVLYFYQLGYSAFAVASLFLFYELFGMLTNLVGGYLASRLGLNVTLHVGMGLQIIALSLLTAPDTVLTVAYVMFAQALSGIAKDLNKMSAKTCVKTLVSKNADAQLFKWVAVLTGSKNTLKGVGFFLGAALLQWLGFRGALITLALFLAIALVITLYLLPSNLGKANVKPKFSQIFSQTAAINWLSAARFFLFGARDVWFVVALPVFLSGVLNWRFTDVGTFMALWVIGYGVVQASAPRLLKLDGNAPQGSTARNWSILLCLVPAIMALALTLGYPPQTTVIVGLAVFGIVFAINSAVHSYLILAYASDDKVAMNVGFYYMANAGGRLVGTLLSGWGYQQYGLTGCLWISTAFIAMAFCLSLPLANSQEKVAP